MDALKIMAAAQRCGFPLSQEQGEKLAFYYRYLLSENQTHNLTRIVAEEDVLYEHFVDSLWGVAATGNLPAAELLDLGSGAGFPGIPLKKYCPSLHLYLLETSRKKTAFLQRLAQMLELRNVTFLTCRAEDYGRGDGRDAHTWVTARAVASLVVLAELALPLLKRGGVLWAYKGPGATAELDEAWEIMDKCGGTPKQILTYSLPPWEKERQILIFEKTGETEPRFPRKAGIPQKRPFYNKASQGKA